MTRASNGSTTGKESFRARVASQGPLVAIAQSVKAGARRLKGLVPGPLMASSLLAGGLAAAGFAAFYLGWRGAAASLVVGVQITYLASGGVAGFALLLSGLGILVIQISRHLAARERVELDEAVDRALSALAAVTALQHRSASAATTNLPNERDPSLR